MRTRKRQAFKGDRVITSIALDRDLKDSADAQVPNLSDLMNRLLRAHLRKNDKTIEEVETVSATQRIKNMDAILCWLSERKFAKRGYVKDVLMYELGVTEKKMEEYIMVLIRAGKIRVSGSYIIDPRWEKPADMPTPGTDDFIRWTIAREKEAAEKKKAPSKELDENEAAILGATVSETEGEDEKHD